MPTVPGDYAKVVVKQHIAGWPDNYTVLGVALSPTDVFDAAMAEAICDAIDGVYATHLALFHPAWNLYAMDIQDYREPAGAGFTFSYNRQGTGIGDLLSPDTALVVSWKTGIRGKSYNGRTYLGAVPESTNSADGDVDPSTLAVYDDWAADLIAAVAGVSDGLAIVSTISDYAPRAEALVTPIVQGSANGIFDRQVRRKRR